MNFKFIFIGHRGTRINFDENTISAFKIALEYGADIIEFDIRKTIDNKLIVIHDSSLNRTTNGAGQIKNLSYSEIEAFCTKFKNEKVPLFTDILDKFKGKTHFMIDLKGEDTRTEIIKLILKKEVKKESIIFSGRLLKDLKVIKDRHPEFKTCYNITKGKDLSLDSFLEFENLSKFSFKPDMISLRAKLITPKFIELCHQNKILALAWDFINYENPIAKINDLINMRIDGILFDNYKNIPVIKEFLKKAKNPS